MISNRGTSVRADYRQAASGFTSLLLGLGPDDWTKPGLGVWTVRDLAGHASRALLTVESYLDPTRTADSPALADACAYFRPSESVLADPTAVAERGRQAGAALGDRPAEAVAAIAERVFGLIEGCPDDALVSTPVGTMTLVGYLPTRTFELVVHSLDLVAATGAATPSELDAPLRSCLELAAQLAAGQPQAAEVLLALTGRGLLPAGFSVV